MTKSETQQMNALLSEAIEEGIIDKLRSSVGLKPRTDSEFTIIPKAQWEEFIKDNRQAVEMLANSPGIKDAADLIADILDQLVQNGSMEARKVQQQIRRAIKQRDKEALVGIVRSLQKEADRIRTVRTNLRLKRESPEDIAKLLGEDININNGLIDN